MPSKRDRTKYSINGGPFEFKATFVLSLVRAYINKYPSITYSDLKRVFHNGLCAKGFEHIGLLCTEDEYNNSNLSRKETRYSFNKQNGKISTIDGMTFLVNMEWTNEAMGELIKLAEKEDFVVNNSKELTRENT